MKNFFAVSLLTILSASAIAAEEPLTLSTPLVGSVTVGTSLLVGAAVVAGVVAASNSGGSSNGGTGGTTVPPVPPELLIEIAVAFRTRSRRATCVALFFG
jgi:hypothetical protein